MKKPRLYKWNLTEKTEGLLFFAQSLLFHHTLDSFKAPALNTHLNIFELQFLSAEIFKNKVKAGALKPVCQSAFNIAPLSASKTDPPKSQKNIVHLATDFASGN